MCEHIGFDWHERVAIEDIPLVEEAIKAEEDKKSEEARKAAEKAAKKLENTFC